MYVPKMFNLVMMYTTLTHDKNKGAIIRKRRLISEAKQKQLQSFEN